MTVDAAAKPRAGATGAIGAAPEPQLRGIHHLALTTEDMKTTTDFYVEILGMPLVHAMKVPAGLGTGPDNRGNPPWERLRHYFFDMGGDSLLAFFEIPRGEKPRSDRDAIGGMQHVAFAATSERFEALQQRLADAGVDFSGPVEIFPEIHSIYFFDPNGIRLEATCQPADGNAPRVVSGLTQTAAEARPELETLTDDGTWIDSRTTNLND